MPTNNSNQLNDMLNMAGKKLGISPEALRNALSDPNKAQQLLGEIDKKTNGKINATNPDAMKNMMKNNPNAQKIFNDLIRGGKNG
jgi:hypothetical protein